MSGKFSGLIWVESYYRDDGTHVNGYWRHLPGDGISNTLTGGISSNNYLNMPDFTDYSQNKTAGEFLNHAFSSNQEDNIAPVIKNKGWNDLSSGFMNAVSDIAKIALNALPLTSTASIKSNNLSQPYTSDLESRITEVQKYKDLIQSHLAKNQSALENLKPVLDKMTIDLAQSNPIEYSKKYQDFEPAYNHYKKVKNTTETAQAYSNNDMHKESHTEMMNLKEISDKIQKTKKDLSNFAHNTSKKINNFVHEKENQVLNNINNNIDNTPPNVNKKNIDNSFYLLKYLIPYSAYFWKLSSNNKPIPETITLNSINEIKNIELNEFLHKKVKQQLNLNDLKGVLFVANSSLSSKIKDSVELNNFIVKNKNQLLSGETVKGSLNFNKYIDTDLWGTYHLADVYESRINEYGDFYAIIIDTYDFNNNSPTSYVRMARTAKDANLIDNYFSVILVYINKDELNIMKRKLK